MAKKKPAESRVTRPTKKVKVDGPAKFYTLAVSLLSGPITKKFAKKNKSVVRTIQIRGDQTLEQLHDTIFEAFGRDDPHMYEFQMGRMPMDPKGPRYVLPMAADEDWGPPIRGTVDVTKINEMGLKAGRSFGYWFDFGDDWHHQIDVEKIEAGPGEGTYPRVIDRKGESPPQYPELDDE